MGLQCSGDEQPVGQGYFVDYVVGCVRSVDKHDRIEGIVINRGSRRGAADPKNAIVG